MYNILDILWWVCISISFWGDVSCKWFVIRWLLWNYFSWISCTSNFFRVFSVLEWVFPSLISRIFCTEKSLAHLCTGISFKLLITKDWICKAWFQRLSSSFKIMVFDVWPERCQSHRSSSGLSWLNVGIRWNRLLFKIDLWTQNLFKICCWEFTFVDSTEHDVFKFTCTLFLSLIDLV